MAEVEEIINEPSEASKRISQLSGEVKSISEERDAAQAKADEAQAKIEAAERRASFAEGFADIISQNPEAKDFRTEIEEKVMGGMSMEDAKFAVLGKAGKLGAPAPEPESIVGGSAPVTVTVQGPKTAESMTQEERRSALMEAEARGDISLT